jgi:8-hydroxy-5-deazaflavin:NADPH oxidoreductase
MNLLVVGTGNVACALVRRFAATDHTVSVGSRDADRGAEIGASLGVEGGVASERVADADVIFLAVPFPALDETIQALGPMAGKVVVDCTNPLSDDYLALTHGHTTSAGEQCLSKLPEARVVKGFNAIFADVVHANTQYNGVKPQVFLAGDDLEAKEIAADLVRAIDYEPVDSGPMQNARYLEPLAELIIQLAYVQGEGTQITPIIVRSAADPA